MFLKLLALPSELFQMIIDLLPIQALLAASRTCHTFRSLLVPLIVAHYSEKVNTILCWAAENNRPDLFKCAIYEGASLPFNPRLADLLAKAVDREYVDIVRLLLAHGANPDKGFPRTPPLASAVCGGDVVIARMLLEAGADVSIVLQRFSVHQARTRKQWAMASLLYELELGSHLASRRYRKRRYLPVRDP